jgi:hypothetical protein
MSLPASFLLVFGLAILAGTGSASAAPANDSPFTPVEVDGCANVLTGSTVDAANDVDLLNCPNDDSGSGYVQPYGGDVFYRVTVPWSYDLHVLVEPLGDWDVSLYVFTSPWNPDETCLTGADIAGPGFGESVVVQNASNSGQPREYIIAVDSWRADQAGAFNLTLTCDFAVGNDAPTFGALKSRFGGGER